MPNVKSFMESLVDTLGYSATRAVLHKVLGSMVKNASMKEASYYAVADLMYIYLFRGSALSMKLFMQTAAITGRQDEMQKDVFIFAMLTLRDVLASKEKLSTAAIDNAIAVFAAGVVNNIVDENLPTSYLYIGQ